MSFSDEDIHGLMASEIGRYGGSRVEIWGKDGLDGFGLGKHGWNGNQRKQRPPRFLGRYKKDVAAAATQLLAAGISIRKTAASVGLSKVTVMRIRSEMRQRGVPFASCPCGQSATHNGWCRVRVAESPSRQTFLRERWGKLMPPANRTTISEKIMHAIELWDFYKSVGYAGDFREWLEDCSTLNPPLIEEHHD